MNAISQMLNDTVWAKLAPSKVHGIGVFAIRDIPRGQQIYAQVFPKKEFIIMTDFEDLHPAIKELILQRYPLAPQGEPFQSPNDDARLISFMNHSDTPNYDKYIDAAIVDIKEGEEIFENYLPEASVDFIHTKQL